VFHLQAIEKWRSGVYFQDFTVVARRTTTLPIFGCPAVLNYWLSSGYVFKRTTEIWTRKYQLFQFVIEVLTEKMKPSQYLQNLKKNWVWQIFL
jgi:hypothetical protein